MRPPQFNRWCRPCRRGPTCPGGGFKGAIPLGGGARGSAPPLPPLGVRRHVVHLERRSCGRLGIPPVRAREPGLPVRSAAAGTRSLRYLTLDAMFWQFRRAESIDSMPAITPFSLLPPQAGRTVPPIASKIAITARRTVRLIAWPSGVGAGLDR